MAGVRLVSCNVFDALWCMICYGVQKMRFMRDEVGFPRYCTTWFTRHDSLFGEKKNKKKIKKKASPAKKYSRCREQCDL
jgi:hypothetical protein